MVAAQRRLGSDGAVMEGRDIGSVVFPNATAKLFLTASDERRAARRVSERGGNDELGGELAARDTKDAKTNPPTPAPGAVAIDTEDKDADQVLAEALAIVRAATGSQNDAAE
jgi:cytidylate kinase